MNVIRSVTRNGRSIVLTAVLALILVYLFSIIGYMFFKDDFLVEVDADERQTSSTTPSMPDITVSMAANGADNTCSAPDSFNKRMFCAGGGNGGAEAGSTVTAVSGGCGGDAKERSCDSLVMCIVTTLNQGLRNGGGIGDILRAPSSKVSDLKKKLSRVDIHLNFPTIRKVSSPHESFTICFSSSSSSLSC